MSIQIKEIVISIIGAKLIHKGLGVGDTGAKTVNLIYSK